MTQHNADYDAADVTPVERETTRRMVGHLLSMLADEPSQDAGGHPAIEVHQQVGAAWADWDRRRLAWCALLAPRLLREAMDDVRGGPHSRPFPSVDMCHNGHPFAPGIDIDHPNEPHDDWCNSCGEARVIPSAIPEAGGDQ